MLKLSLHRIYTFYFFTGGYAFLSLWISVTYFFKEFPFLIFGIICYILLTLFHKAIIKITEKNQTTEIKSSFRIDLFYLRLIIFSIIFLTAVYFMQWLAIYYLDFPSKVFRIVNWGLNFLSISISFLFSFFDKKAV